ncbi:hypothetical protein ZTR_09836 [Talaromyces verruculosus]|nr:hypothetical protein ZTR_09836 [Talaromyces verruculosus]
MNALPPSVESHYPQSQRARTETGSQVLSGFMSMTQPRVPGDVSVQVDWLQRERELDPIAIREREYKGNLHGWVWELWSRFCNETKRDPLTLMQEHPPCTLKIYNFWDYTLTTRRDRIDAASTLQTYHNVWTLIREQKTGLSIPQSLKKPMADGRRNLAVKHGLRTEALPKPRLRSDEIFQLLKTLWTTNADDEGWDPVQLSLFILLAGYSSQRAQALLTLRHSDFQVVLLPDPAIGHAPRPMVEIKPDNTKEYGGVKKSSPMFPILEVPQEKCLMLCPLTMVLALMIRQDAFGHMDVHSATQIYSFEMPPGAGELPLRSNDPNALLFDVTYDTMVRWLKRLGLLTRIREDLKTYMLRRGALEAMDLSGHITPDQKLQLAQHADESVRRKNYMPDHFSGDIMAAALGTQPQDQLLRAASGLTRSIRPDRPIDLTNAQEAAVQNDDEVQSALKDWRHLQAAVVRRFGAYERGRGSTAYKIAQKARNKYHSTIRKVRERMKIRVREQFEQEQPVIDVLRQVHGIPADPSPLHRESRPCPREQDYAFHQLFRMVPPYSNEERRWRAAAVDAVAQVHPGARRRLQASKSIKAKPNQPVKFTRRTDTVTLPVHPSLVQDNQCLWCVLDHVAGETLKSPFSRKRHERRWHYGSAPHPKPWKCPDAACTQEIVDADHWENHRDHYHTRLDVKTHGATSR